MSRRSAEPLSIPQIEEARLKFLQNARQLLSEARLLYSRRHFARAYALAHLSCEEMARLPMLVGAGLRLARGKPVDWSRVHDRLRSHRRKLLMLEVMEAKEKDIATIARSVMIFNRIKNHSLYAEEWKGRFRKPSEVVRDADAREMICLARNRLRLFSRVERNTRGKIDDTCNWEGFHDLLTAMEQRVHG